MLRCVSFLALFLTVFRSLSAQAADQAGCKDPPWAKQRLPGFELSACEHKAWESLKIETVDGSRRVEGAVDVITYTLIDESKNPSSATAWKHFVAEGKKAGAKLVSEPGGGYNATLTTQSGKAEVWYMYEHGSGNEESTGSYMLTTVEVTPLAQEVEARPAVTDWDMPASPCKDPPWLVKQFPYFKRERCEVRDFDQVTLELPEGQKTIAGHVYSIVYVLTDEKKNPVPAAVHHNYVRALQAIGAKLASDPEDNNQAFLTRRTPQGELWYLYRHGSGNERSTRSYELTYVQPVQETGKACTMRVYGVNFDFDKATLRSDSEPVLNQVLALFKNNASYSAEIGGHTDDVGDKAYNRKLSGERAAAVKDWLVAHGIAASRMTTAGYGQAQPLVPNTSDENRARNRRVELKRQDCQQ